MQNQISINPNLQSVLVLTTFEGLPAAIEC